MGCQSTKAAYVVNNPAFANGKIKEIEGNYYLERNRFHTKLDPHVLKKFERHHAEQLEQIARKVKDQELNRELTQQNKQENNQRKVSDMQKGRRKTQQRIKTHMTLSSSKQNVDKQNTAVGKKKQLLENNEGLQEILSPIIQHLNSRDISGGQNFVVESLSIPGGNGKFQVVKPSPALQKHFRQDSDISSNKCNFLRHNVTAQEEEFQSMHSKLQQASQQQKQDSFTVNKNRSSQQPKQFQIKQNLSKAESETSIKGAEEQKKELTQRLRLEDSSRYHDFSQHGNSELPRNNESVQLSLRKSAVSSGRALQETRAKASEDLLGQDLNPNNRKGLVIGDDQFIQRPQMQNKIGDIIAQFEEDIHQKVFIGSDGEDLQSPGFLAKLNKFPKGRAKLEPLKF